MIKRQTLTILAVICMMTMFATAASANNIENATIGIGDGSGYVTIPITITNSTNVGSVDVTLRYDSSIVVVADVVDVDMDNTIINLENTADGWIRIVAYQVGDGLSGTFVLANVSFEPVGTTGSCPLEISVNTFKDATPIGNVMPYVVDNGIYTLTSEESDDRDDGDDDRYAWYLYEDHGSDENVTEEQSSGNETPIETPTAPPLKNLPGEDELHDEDNDDEDQNSLWWIVIAIVALIIAAIAIILKMRNRKQE